MIMGWSIGQDTRKLYLIPWLIAAVATSSFLPTGSSSATINLYDPPKLGATRCHSARVSLPCLPSLQLVPYYLLSSGGLAWCLSVSCRAGPFGSTAPASRRLARELPVPTIPETLQLPKSPSGIPLDRPRRITVRMAGVPETLQVQLTLPRD